MPDGDFKHTRNATQEQRQIVSVQIMSGINTEFAAHGGVGSFAIEAQRGLLTSRPERTSIRLSIKLNAVRADVPSNGHGVRISVHEQADPDAHGLELRNHRSKTRCIAGEIPAVIRSGRVLGIRYQRALVWWRVAHHVQQLVKRIAFNVVFSSPAANQLKQCADVSSPNVARIRARMDGNAMRAAIKGKSGHMLDVRYIERARIA